MKQYLNLLADIRDNGIIKTNRTGTDTLSVFGRQLRFDLNEGFPLLTTKKIFIKGVLYELFWFLGIHMKDEQYKNVGKNPITNTKYLKDNGVSIWDEWADEEGDLGKVYGHQWTNWEYYHKDKVLIKEYINQIDTLINDLKNNPDSRRLMVSAWNPGQLKEMNLPPCHYGFQCYSVDMGIIERQVKWNEYAKNNSLDITGMSNDQAMKHYNFPKRKLTLMWNQRSVDTFLGLPFNIASYAFLTHMLADVTNHVVDELVCNLGDTHLYVNHMEYVEKQLLRKPRNLSKLKMVKRNSIYDYKFEDFDIKDYDPYKNWKNVPIAI